MMFTHLSDPDMPGLQGLSQADLDRITGTQGTRLLRARYQPGARAVLHVAMPEGQEGSIWFFAGSKAQSLARRHPDARLDAASGAMFQSFPQDHRIPHLAQFLSQSADLAPVLIGGRLAEPPKLMRYRPGLSATFRMTRQDGSVFFVKQTPGEDVLAQARAVADLRSALSGSCLGVAAVAGTIPELGLIAYASAQGAPLDQILPGSGSGGVIRAITQVAQALQTLWSLPLRPERKLDRSALLDRSEKAARLIALLDPRAGRIAMDMVESLHDTTVQLRFHPIHADLKLEHIFLSGPATTLIDTESLSSGDPDYDLAKLQCRLEMAEAAGILTTAEVATATAQLRKLSGPQHGWLATCARLQCAKFYAQRLDPATIPLLLRVLSRPQDG